MLYGHGGDIYRLARSLGVSPKDIKDFSSNVSPLPLPDGLRQRLIASLEEITALPEVDSFTLREALARRYGLSSQNFLIGSGTTEWIYSLPRVSGARRALIPLPTYADYADAASVAGCDIETLGPWLDGGQDINLNILNAITDKARQGDIVFICNPNNPTGRFIPTDILMDVIRAAQDVVWVVDESYAPFVGEDQKTSLISSNPPSNLLILRSFSKIYGIPGLRLGYTFGAPYLIEKLSSVSKPWAVNRLAQVAGEYLVEMLSYEEDVREYCKNEKRRFLSRIEIEVPFLKPMEGSTHFILFKVMPPWKVSKVVEALKDKRILVRDCGNFMGCSEDYLRISLRSRQDNNLLLSLLKGLSP
ncbi:MAG: pyridoxal phosphate-dependent aminotransferase [Dissulfurimicrobium sp.]|uniref:pyridoxal phosphate-dependent aminotransferase n=1 Tax=Dissulfurimicrobium sp. TaxID=2022436 RepID=UPI004049CCCC